MIIFCSSDFSKIVLLDAICDVMADGDGFLGDGKIPNVTIANNVERSA